jgi:hypothetical protein
MTLACKVGEAFLKAGDFRLRSFLDIVVIGRRIRRQTDQIRQNVVPSGERVMPISVEVHNLLPRTGGAGFE